jgi:type I restriction enzyme S subunit
VKPHLPLKRFVDPLRPITYGIVQAGEDVVDGIPYIRPVDMVGNEGVPDPNLLRRTAPEIAAMYKRSEVRAGDIVVSIGPSFGKVMIVPPELAGANLTQGTARAAPGNDIEGRFLYWALQSHHAIAFWESEVSGATFRALNLEPLGRTPIPRLPLCRQVAIADYLDRETTRISAVVERLGGSASSPPKSLSGLLLEKRRALITAAVTDELPDAAEALV